MKRLLKNALALLLITLFVGCNSGLSISKRRYTKGYYVHHNKGTDHKTRHVQRSQQKPAPVVRGRATEMAAAGTASETEKAGEERLLADASGAAVNNETKASSKNSGTMIPVDLIVNPVKTFKDIKEKISADPAKSEALSLLWILILVLLAVYIAGLLLDTFGLGWVIHLLLVAALVLLILWLLRIV